MSDARWERIKAVFEAALMAPAEDRPVVIDRECGGDLELRREVESLLEARTRAIVRTAGAAHAMAETVTMSSPDEQPGAFVGRYKLLQAIGEGGFGIVWLAEQREPVKRCVALKVIKLGMDTRQVTARFEAERQALAMMDHPNIAKVFDAGATDTGRPFFVMEYIKGVPMCEYCNAEQLDTRARLELFAGVCNAIQHAHMKGIIHRDIKPSNVLVTMHDGVPVPKVIDFGIAKATGSELTARTLFTEHRQLLGTPAYMSPEQAEMSGLDIDTRSDIYSLGVLLYELLTGAPPFDSASLLQAGFAEMLRIIREVEPPKPSTRLGSEGATTTKAGRQRQAGDPRRLGLILRGDLDWIVMKCLEKDRTRRYETASGLAGDIRRHLCNEPVTAGPPHASYRLRKFVRRNRGKVAAASIVVGTLVLGVVGTTAGMVWALDERDKAQHAAESEAAARTAADTAKAEEAKARKHAETISAFVTAALNASDAKNAGADGGIAQAAHDMTVLAAMENAVKDIDSGRFKDDPQTEAELRYTIGRILMNNGQYDKARPLLERPLEIREKLLPADSPWVADCLNELGLLCYNQRRYEEAEGFYARAIAIHEKTGDAGNVNLASCLDNLAVVYSTTGRHPEAESLVVRAIALDEKAPNPDEGRSANRLNTLASIRYKQGRFTESADLLTRVIAIWEKTRGPDHPDVASIKHNLATTQKRLGKFVEAETLYEQALAAIEKANGPDHPSVAAMLKGLAGVKVNLKKPAEAEPLQKRALAIMEKTLGSDHPDVLVDRASLAAIYCWLGRFDQSVPLFEEVVKAQEAALGRQHPATLTSVANLGQNYKDSGRLGEAIPLLEEAYLASKQLPELGFVRAQLLDAYTLAADPAKPETVARLAALLREFLDAVRAKLPKDSPDLAPTLVSYSTTLMAAHAWTDAEPMVREALALRQSAAPDSWLTFNTRSMLGGVLLGQNRLAEAEPLLLDGYKGMIDREATIPAAGKPRIPEALERLVRLYEAKSDEPQAAAWRSKLEAAQSLQAKPAGKEDCK